jgi:hypothetical protein
MLTIITEKGVRTMDMGHDNSPIFKLHRIIRVRCS